VRVGDSGNFKEFKIDQIAACSNSSFFRAAMAHDFKEAKTRVVNLTAEDLVMFKVWLHWIMARTISSPILPTNAKIDDDVEFDHLVKTYALGEKVDDVGFKDVVIDAICAKSFDNNARGKRYFLGGESTGLVWRATLPGSPLRKLVLDQHVLLADPEWFSGHKEPFEYDFLLDLALEFANVKRTKPTQEICYYHSHDKVGLPCYRQMYEMASKGKACLHKDFEVFSAP